MGSHIVRPIKYSPYVKRALFCKANKTDIIMTIQNNTPKSCLICWEEITQNKMCGCLGCKILLHRTCAKKYRQSCENDDNKCPHCQRPNSITICLATKG